MNDNELLQVVSDMLAKQLQPIYTKLDKLDSIESDVLGLKADMVIVKSDVSGLKSDVAGLKADMTDVKSDIADLKSDVASIDSDVTGIKVTLENDIQRNFSLLVEGIGAINDKLDRTSTTADSNTDDIDVLKSAIRILAK